MEVLVVVVKEEALLLGAVVEPLVGGRKAIWWSSCRETFCGALPAGTWTGLRSHTLDICELLHELGRGCQTLLPMVQVLVWLEPVVVLLVVVAAEAVAVVEVVSLDHWGSCC